tara:strand:+ start:597 stop:875 length:279 start_codon:yes stop_codon:yes gene_type:complete
MVNKISIIGLVVSLIILYFGAIFTLQQAVGGVDCPNSWQKIVDSSINDVTCSTKNNCVSFMVDNGAKSDEIPPTRCVNNICEVKIPECIKGR